MPYKDPIKQKEYKKLYMKKYNENSYRKKKSLFNTWKSRGLTGDYEAIYTRYINTNNCDLCNIELNKKCMDHNHTTGEFRNIVCPKCNCNKSDKSKLVYLI